MTSLTEGGADTELAAATSPDARPAADRGGGRAVFRSPPAVLRPVGIFAASRLAMAVVVGVAVKARPGLTFTNALHSWDGAWYNAVARSGYPRSIPVAQGKPVATTIAFFPGLPLAMRAVHTVTGISLSGAGILVTGVFGLAFTIILWLFVRRTADSRSADRATALVCFFPGFFIFGLTYAEPVSLCLSVLCLYSLLRRWWWAAGLSAGLASGVHPDAVVLTLCCAVAAGLAIRERREWIALVAPALAPVGILAYFTYLHFHAHSFRAYLTATKAPGWDDRISPQHMLTLLHSVVWQHSIRDLNSFFPALGVLFVLITIPLLLWSRFPIPFKVYGVGVGLLHLMTSLGPRPRFILAAFPLIVALADRLKGLSFTVVFGTFAVVLGAVGVLTISTLLLVP